jgi:SAM-dependent methyltransferase
MNCRLCLTENNFVPAHGQDGKDYYLCNKCHLISAYPSDIINTDMEKDIYLCHENSIEDSGYINFLDRAIKPAMQFINKSMLGLDYGAGYAATLSQILERRGYNCENYDPYFIHNSLDKKFEYVFSTETFEHFLHPNREVQKIYEILNNNGYLIVMTERWDSLERFRNWYYTRDPSHIAFYHTKTFDYICKKFGFKIIYDDEHRVIILQKSKP